MGSDLPAFTQGTEGRAGVKPTLGQGCQECQPRVNPVNQPFLSQLLRLGGWQKTEMTRVPDTSSDLPWKSSDFQRNVYGSGKELREALGHPWFDAEKCPPQEKGLEFTGLRTDVRPLPLLRERPAGTTVATDTHQGLTLQIRGVFLVAMQSGEAWLPLCSSLGGAMFTS